jgi:hypothetical protein
MFLRQIPIQGHRREMLLMVGVLRCGWFCRALLMGGVLQRLCRWLGYSGRAAYPRLIAAALPMGALFPRSSHPFVKSDLIRLGLREGVVLKLVICPRVIVSLR